MSYENQGQCIGTPARESQVGSCCSQISGALDRLEKASSNVESRFGPVLRCDPPVPTNGAGPRDADSAVPMVATLTSFLTRIHTRAGFLEGLADRCEL